MQRWQDRRLVESLRGKVDLLWIWCRHAWILSEEDVNSQALNVLSSFRSGGSDTPKHKLESSVFNDDLIMFN